MLLIVGLGNPQKKYLKTRHNLGFLFVDYLKENFDDFSVWQLKRKLKAEISEGRLGSPSLSKPLLLAKPQTYMNNSGDAVRLIAAYLCLSNNQLVIVHDDFDLPLGQFRWEKGRGSAGHKGVQSIIDALKTKDFWRLRIGIKPANLEPPAKAEEYVLKNFKEEEEKLIQKTIKNAAVFLIEQIPALVNSTKNEA